MQISQMVQACFDEAIPGNQGVHHPRAAVTRLKTFYDPDACISAWISYISNDFANISAWNSRASFLVPGKQNTLARLALQSRQRYKHMLKISWRSLFSSLGRCSLSDSPEEDPGSLVAHQPQGRKTDTRQSCHVVCRWSQLPLYILFNR